MLYSQCRRLASLRGWRAEKGVTRGRRDKKGVARIKGTKKGAGP